MEAGREEDVASATGRSDQGASRRDQERAAHKPHFLRFDAGQPIDLEASLLGGQAHRWRQEDGWYSGVVRGNLVLTRQRGSSHRACQRTRQPGVVAVELS